MTPLHEMILNEMKIQVLTPYERWQMEKYGNYIPETELKEVEEDNRLAEYGERDEKTIETKKPE